MANRAKINSKVSPSEVEFHIFAEAAGVVIADGLCVAKWLEQWVGLQDLLGNDAVAAFVHSRQVLHDELRALRLSCTTLSTDGENGR